MVYASHVLKGKQIHDASPQRILIKHIRCARQWEVRQPSQHVCKIIHVFCAFTNKCLKRLNEKCHPYFDKPQKTFNCLHSRINTTQGFQDPDFSRECSKLTGSPLSLDWA